MSVLPDEVWINGLTACVVCPVHGEQAPEVEYQAGGLAAVRGFSWATYSPPG